MMNRGITAAGHRSSRGERERGQALVELALVLPVFLLLLLGIVQFGSVFRDYIALTDATRVGARQAAVSRSLAPGTDRVAGVTARVQKAGVNLDPLKMTVSVQITDPADPTSDDDSFNESLDSSWQTALDVTVRATYPFKVNLFGMVLHEGTLKSRTTERIE
jgi:Flp pilus assembly protein TadG